MKFIEMEHLKPGMRLARPIYNKKGVLLVERGTGLTQQNIDNVKYFGLLGVYVLEPAEPLSPMSDEDKEYERFQISTGFVINEELGKIISGKKQIGIYQVASTIQKNFGHMDKKLNFYQNLRSIDDYVSRHSLNVAILCVLLMRRLNIKLDEQMLIVQAALVHDIGKIAVQRQKNVPLDKIRLENITLDDKIQALDLLDDVFASNATALKRMCYQVLKAQDDVEKTGTIQLPGKMVMGAKILMVANRYDELTAVDYQGKAESEIKALRELQGHPDLYDEEIVNALVKSVNILIPGASVVLNTGEKALVLAENSMDVLRPIVLTFGDNSTINLALYENRYIMIEDIMKTMDNRYIINKGETQ